MCSDSLVYGVNFHCRRPMKFSGTVSLISWARWSWAVVYVHSLYFFGFWLVLGFSLVGPSLQLVNWGPVHPHVLYSVVQMWTGVLKLILLCVQGFEASLSLLFSCLFWVIFHYLLVFLDQSWIEVSVGSTPSFTFFHCYLLVLPLLVGFLFQQVYWCSELPPGKFSGVAKWNLSHCLSY